MEVLGLGDGHVSDDGRMIGLRLETSDGLVPLQGNAALMESLTLNLMRLIADAKRVSAPTALVEAWDVKSARVSAVQGQPGLILTLEVMDGYDLHFHLDQSMAQRAQGGLAAALKLRR